jgi:hypothetical protein
MRRALRCDAMRPPADLTPSAQPNPMLVSGAVFLKYGRNGPKPKRKFVCVANKPRRLIWASTPEFAYMRREGCAGSAASAGRRSRACAVRVGDKSSASEVSLENVVAVRIGKHTKVFERKVPVPCVSARIGARG